MRYRNLYALGFAIAATSGAGDGTAQSSASPGARPFVIEILAGHALESDGRGPYRDGEAGVGAFGLNAITLCSDGRRCSTMPEAGANGATARTFTLDLGHPAPGSPAVARGRVTPTKGNFGAFWELDTTRRAINNGIEGWAIRRALDIPVGMTVVSQRVEIRFVVDGRQHILQLGPWTAGQFQANQGLLSGTGSTPATITRTSDSTWVVRSGDRSLGRLWDNHEPSHPVDLGLYEFSFEVRYAALVTRDASRRSPTVPPDEHRSGRTFDARLTSLAALARGIA